MRVEQKLSDTFQYIVKENNPNYIEHQAHDKLNSKR